MQIESGTVLHLDLLSPCPQHVRRSSLEILLKSSRQVEERPKVIVASGHHRDELQPRATNIDFVEEKKD
jgi:hypothetical protein